MSGTRTCAIAFAATLALAQVSSAADHGPVFGLATPTNPKGGWSFDLGVNGRGGTAGSASNVEAELSYGLTANLKLAVSAPIVFQPDPYARSSVTMNTPTSGDFSGLAWWRFQRKDFGHMEVQITVDDPKAYTKPWAVTEKFNLVTNGDLLEFICENNRDLQHMPPSPSK